MMMMVDTNFSSQLSQINRAQSLAATYNGLSVNNDGSETPWWSGGVNFFNDTAWKGANLKARAGNGALESVLDTVLTPTMGWAGYRPNNLGSTYDQDRRAMIRAMNNFITKQDSTGLTALNIPIPSTEAENKQFIAVLDNFINIENQSGQSRSGRNLSVEKYAKEGYKQYLQELNELQNQQIVMDNGIINAQKLATATYAQSQLQGKTELGETFKLRIEALKNQYPDLKEHLDATVAKYDEEFQKNRGTGVAGQVGNQKLAYSRAMTFLMDKLDQEAKVGTDGTKGIRSQDQLDKAFQGDNTKKNIVDLISSINVLAGGTDKGKDQMELIQQKRMAEAGFAINNMDSNKVYQLAEGTQATNVNTRQKQIKNLGEGRSLWRGADGKVYFQETKYDADGIRSTSSRLYQTNQSDEELKATKKISTKNLAPTGKLFIQKQNKDRSEFSEQGNLYALEVDFSVKSRQTTQAAIAKAKTAAKADTLTTATESTPNAIAPKAVASTDAGDHVAATLGGAAAGATIASFTPFPPLTAPVGAFIGAGIGLFSSLKTTQPAPLTKDTSTANATSRTSSTSTAPAQQPVASVTPQPPPIQKKETAKTAKSASSNANLASTVINDSKSKKTPSTTAKNPPSEANPKSA
ncbi:MAG: hypothetical protein HEQ32_08765 [Vampirovibrio sp.]